MPQPSNNLKIRLSSVGNPVIDKSAPTQLETGFNPDDLKIQFKVSVEINRPESQVIIVVMLEYLLGQNQLFSGSLTSDFSVVDLASYITTQEDDKFRIESDFLPMLISIAFSTTRGYFVRELAGTVLEPYPFPIVSMDSIQKRSSYHLI